MRGRALLLLLGLFSFDALRAGDGESGDGEVTVVMGSADGLNLTGLLVIRDSTDGFPGNGFSLGRHGWSLARGDFDFDGTSDLAIGAPYDDYLFEVSNQAAGAELVVYGSRPDPN